MRCNFGKGYRRAINACPKNDHRLGVCYSQSNYCSRTYPEMLSVVYTCQMETRLGYQPYSLRTGFQRVANSTSFRESLLPLLSLNLQYPSCTAVADRCGRLLLSDDSVSFHAGISSARRLYPPDFTATPSRYFEGRYIGSPVVARYLHLSVVDHFVSTVLLALFLLYRCDVHPRVTNTHQSRALIRIFETFRYVRWDKELVIVSSSDIGIIQA